MRTWLFRLHWIKTPNPKAANTIYLCPILSLTPREQATTSSCSPWNCIIRALIKGAVMDIFYWQVWVKLWGLLVVMKSNRIDKYWWETKAVSTENIFVEMQTPCAFSFHNMASKNITVWTRICQISVLYFFCIFHCVTTFVEEQWKLLSFHKIQRSNIEVSFQPLACIVCL